MNVQVRELPPRHVAYMRYVGPFGPHGIPETWEKLRTWLATRDLRPDVTLGVSHDDPSITAPDRCRYDACVPVPPDFQADRWVNLIDIPGGKYAVREFVGTAHEIVGAWDQIFRTWLPDSGWQPDDRPCYELYPRDPNVDTKTRTFRCDLCLPVRAL